MWRRAFPVRVKRLWVVDAPFGTGPLISGILGAGAPELQEIVKFAYREEVSNEQPLQIGGESSNTPIAGLHAMVAELGELFVLPKSLGGEPGNFQWNAILEGDWLQ